MDANARLVIKMLSDVRTKRRVLSQRGNETLS